MSILPAQCRAARALVDMGQSVLARRAVVSRDTIVDFENGSRAPIASNLVAIRAALEEAGVTFIDENGEEPGVRLRKSTGFETLASSPTARRTGQNDPERASFRHARNVAEGRESGPCLGPLPGPMRAHRECRVARPCP